MGPAPAKYSHTRIEDSVSIYLFPRLPEEIYSQEKKANKLSWRLTKAPLVWAGEEPTMTIQHEEMRNRIVEANFKWKQAQMMIDYSYKQLEYAVNKWAGLQTISDG